MDTVLVRLERGAVLVCREIVLLLCDAAEALSKVTRAGLAAGVTKWLLVLPAVVTLLLLLVSRLVARVAGLNLPPINLPPRDEGADKWIR